MHDRRDPETARPLKALYEQLGYHGGFSGPRGGLGNWANKHTEIALVLADGLLQNGYSVGNDLTRFAKRMQKWMDNARAKRGWVAWDHPGQPKWPQWSAILERIEEALRQIERRTPSERAWHQRRPHMATIVLRRNQRQGSWRSPTPLAVIGEADGVRGPFPITPADTEDLPSLRKWLSKVGFPPLGKLRKEWKQRGPSQDGRHDYGDVELHRRGDTLLLFPERGWHSVTVELGRSKPFHVGRVVAEIAHYLRERHYLRPELSARRLHRAGVVLDDLQRRFDAVSTGWNERLTNPKYIPNREQRRVADELGLRRKSG